MPRGGLKVESCPPGLRVNAAHLDTIVVDLVFYLVTRHPSQQSTFSSLRSEMLTVRLFACQMQLERLLARQMEILQDAAVQERLQALDWRIPPAALKYLNDAQNGAANDASRENHGRNPLFCFLLATSVPPGPRPGPSDCGSRPWMAVPGHFGPISGHQWQH